MPLLLKVNLRILLFQIYRIRGYSPHLIGEGIDYLLAQDGSDNPVSEFLFLGISGRHRVSFHLPAVCSCGIVALFSTRVWAVPTLKLWPDIPVTSIWALRATSLIISLIAVIPIAALPILQF